MSICAAFAFIGHAIFAMESPLYAGTSEASYSAQLEELAKWCDLQGLVRQAELTRNWLPNRDPNKIYFFNLPESFAAPSKLADSTDAQEWWKRFTELRRQRADELFARAQQAVGDKQFIEAYELTREAVRENPEHARARAVLGFVSHEGRWVTQETAQRLRAGKTWSDKFGWLPSEHLSRYEKGMRPYRSAWIDADEDARLHSNIRNGWRIETEHYAVTTNHSLEEGARLAREMETLYNVWRQVFLPYFATPSEIERWFAGKSQTQPFAARKPLQVVYFRNRQEYIDALKPYQPQIEISLGTYIDKVRTAYFFAGEKQHDATLYHEATHQLFRELRAGTVDPGRKNNFWITEAVACYMESLKEHRLLEDESYGGYFTVGGLDEGRVPAARQRSAVDNIYIPLRELVAFGMNALQADPRLPMIYSQSSGLAQFFMHYADGKFRLPLIDYLIAVYTGRAEIDSLENLTGKRYEELDREYREFIK